MHLYRSAFWQRHPFLRLLPPLIAGILAQHFFQFSRHGVLGFLVAALLVYPLHYLLPDKTRYKYRKWFSLLVHGIVLATGILITYYADNRNSSHWYGIHMRNPKGLLLQLKEDPVSKTASLKATCKVVKVLQSHSSFPVKGEMLVYFKRDSLSLSLKAGDLIGIAKTPEGIRNSGNPGAFDYRQYAAFQGLHQQVFLQKNEWVKAGHEEPPRLQTLLTAWRKRVINLLQIHIPGDGKITGIAEALLIGYKDDLDKDLVQAYSNTGVVHIIAISGLHLGLLYAALWWLLARLPFLKRKPAVSMIITLAGLWIFALLSGASASVLRSAVMFTCISPGKWMKRETSLFNSLGASAFILLCYNPFLLWDVGFQLSYLAIAGIGLLQQRVYRMLYIKNKFFDKTWELLSTTLAAQIAVFPLCLYYFHQFPNLFVISNLLAVPLSTIILFIEIAVVVFSFIPVVAGALGFVAGKLIALLNAFILWIDDCPFAVWDNIPASFFTTILLYSFVALIITWIILQLRKYLFTALFMLCFFSGWQSWQTINAFQNRQLIFYNIPGKQAIDWIQHGKYMFSGDSSLSQKGLMQNFHLRPSRILHRVVPSKSSVIHFNAGNAWQFRNKRLLFIDSAHANYQPGKITPVNLMIITGNPKTSIGNLLQAIKPSFIVFDATNRLWKIAKWKKECEALLLPCFSIPEKGAFIFQIE